MRLPWKMWKLGDTLSGSSRVATVKSIVSGWCSTCIVSKVPQAPQNCRVPKLLDRKRFTTSSPPVKTKSAAATVEKTSAGAPELSWQVRQWHQPVSQGALFSA